MTTTDIHIRIDKDVKEDSESILRELGITISDLVNMTLRKTIRQRGIPFDVDLDTTKRIPKNMRVETKEELMALIEESFANDDGTRYSIQEVKEHIRALEKSYRHSGAKKGTMATELQTA